MNRLDTGIAIRFSAEDVALFSTASHDRNPLHLSAAYARTTPFGQPVVFGVLGGLACLQSCRERPGLVLSNLVLEFPQPIYTGIEYQLQSQGEGNDQSRVRLTDGRRIAVKMVATYRRGGAWTGCLPDKQQSEAPTPDLEYLEPVGLAKAQLAPGYATTGAYPPAPAALARLNSRFDLAQRSLDLVRLRALLCCSYLTGMVLPGRHALFSRLAIDFAETPGLTEDLISLPMTYEAEVQGWDERFSLLKISGRFYGGGMLLATAELRSFVRPTPPVVSGDAIERMLPRSTVFRDKVALVIGASRGLGAAIGQALALQGCTVLAIFHRSREAAEGVRATVADAPGQIVLLQGDAADSVWMQTVKQRVVQGYGRLDFLVCNAGPPLLPLWLEPAATDRINQYVAQSLDLVTIPMATFLDLLAKHGGWNVVISSAAVHTAPAEWPHYVSAKYAVEGVTRVAATEYQTVPFLLVRPARLQTGLTNTPLGSQEAIPPEEVAARIVQRLREPGNAGQVELLEIEA